jgi:mono/diheme cytochrome c family protein
MTVGHATRSILLAAGCLFLGGDVSAQRPNLKVPLDGPSIYKAYCAACHGADAKGHGPTAEALKSQPTDLTTIAKNNRGQFPRATIQDVLQNGGKWKAHGSKEMPTWGPLFLAVDANDNIAYAHIYNLVTYLESIQVK